MAAAVELLRPFPNAELIWASPRELLNIFQADAVGCHIITVTNDVLKKLELVGKDLDEFSLDTVKMFYRDALAAGFCLSQGGDHCDGAATGSRAEARGQRERARGQAPRAWVRRRQQGVSGQK
jgi:hypothetical protein